MFGIGLPEFIVILAVALIVVGPEKLPELAKTMAKHLLELKKAANTFKESLEGEVGGTPLDKPNNTPATPVNPIPWEKRRETDTDQASSAAADSETGKQPAPPPGTAP